MVHLHVWSIAGTLDDVRETDCHLVLLVIRIHLSELSLSTFKEQFLKKTKYHVLKEISGARLCTFFDLSIHHLRNHHQFCNKEWFEIILQVLDYVLTLLSTPVSNLFVFTCMDDDLKST